MTTIAARLQTIMVVDGNSSDYEELFDSTNLDSMEVRLLPGGRAALREARFSAVDLWIVNVRLPDMSGFDLATMVPLGPAVFMVADEYRAEDELRTLSLGLARYLCKPLNVSWVLAGWPPRRPARAACHISSSPILGVCSGDISKIREARGPPV